MATTAHVHLVERVTEKTNADTTTFNSAVVLEKEKGHVSNLYVSQALSSTKMDMLRSLQIGDQFSLTKIIRGSDFIKITPQTNIYTDSVSFDIDETIVHRYTNPDVVPLPDILSSPRKRRVSLHGTITSVSPIKYKRRTLTVQQGNETIQVKLWDDKKDLLDTKPANEVTLTCLYVSKWGAQTSLNSTPFTTMLEGDEVVEKTKQITVQAVLEKSILATDGEEYDISENVEKPSKNDVVNITVIGTKITALSQAQ